jgi:hypothetical protein
MRASGISLAIVLLLAACDSSRGAQGNALPAANETAPAAAPAANADTSDSRDLAVDSEGLRLVDTASGAARPLPFGMAEDQLLALLESFRGPADRGTNEECGAGPLDYAVWADGLTLHFQADAFAGWALDPRAEGAHATMSGIGPGSTRAELEAAYEVTVEQTTLGTEFSAGGMSGVLDGEGADARIGHMWAGVSCVFR